jgi:hypothetical protein
MPMNFRKVRLFIRWFRRAVRRKTLPILLSNLADLAQVHAFAGQCLSPWSTEEHQIHGKDKFIAVIFHRFSFEHIAWRRPPLLYRTVGAGEDFLRLNALLL